MEKDKLIGYKSKIVIGINDKNEADLFLKGDDNQIILGILRLLNTDHELVKIAIEVWQESKKLTS